MSCMATWCNSPWQPTAWAYSPAPTYIEAGQYDQARPRHFHAAILEETGIEGPVNRAAARRGLKHSRRAAPLRAGHRPSARESHVAEECATLPAGRLGAPWGTPRERGCREARSRAWSNLFQE